MATASVLPPRVRFQTSNTGLIFFAHPIAGGVSELPVPPSLETAAWRDNNAPALLPPLAKLCHR